MTTAFLTSLGLNLSDPHFRDTPRRFETWLREATENQNKEWPRLLTTFEERDHMPTVTVGPIAFSSLCCHHLMPFFGSIEISYQPAGRVVGLSKFARACDWLARRAQTQERLTRDLARMISDQSGARSVTVSARAIHTCMSCRGARQHSETTTIHSFST